MAQTNENENKNEQSGIRNAISINYLNKNNANFYYNGDYLALVAELEFIDEENNTKEMRKETFGRIVLHRLFPFSESHSDISVLDREQNEIGIIKELSDFDPETEEMLRKELDKKYFVPKIESIISMKDRYGFSNWKVNTDVGRITFSVKDTYSSITKLNAGRIFIFDVDGNRYEIPDISKLDKRSFKKIELFL